MLSTKETPKKLAAVPEQKNSSCSGDCCWLCECLFNVQKGDKFQYISTENLLQLPGEKGVEKGPLEKLLSEDLGLHLSDLGLQLSLETRLSSRENHWSVYFGINCKQLACQKTINFLRRCEVYPARASSFAGNCITRRWNGANFSLQA